MNLLKSKISNEVNDCGVVFSKHSLFHEQEGGHACQQDDPPRSNKIFIDMYLYIVIKILFAE